MTQKNASDDKAQQSHGQDPMMEQLKAMYDSVVDEPLPQDLLTLLDKLDEAERSR